MELFTLFDIIFTLYTKMTLIIRFRLATMTGFVPAYAK
jgi:hypothetical protein